MDMLVPVDVSDAQSRFEASFDLGANFLLQIDDPDAASPKRRREFERMIVKKSILTGKTGNRCRILHR